MGACQKRPWFGLKKYKVLVKKSAKKELKAIPLNFRQRIAGAITLLAENPFPPNSRKLEGRDGYRIRIGDYRLIYVVKNDVLTILVIRIAHRKDVYR